MNALPRGVPAGFAWLQEFVDRASGTIRARGRLTPAGADLVRGTAALLLRSGRDRVTVDLRAVQVPDGEALAALRVLVGDLRARSAVVLAPPGPDWLLPVILPRLTRPARSPGPAARRRGPARRRPRGSWSARRRGSRPRPR